jgi:hypothetical protein
MLSIMIAYLFYFEVGKNCDFPNGEATINYKL